MATPLSDTALATLLRGLAHEENYVFLDTGKPGADNGRSMIFRAPEQVLRCTARDDGAGFLAEIEARLQRGKYVAGWFSYEFGCLLDPALAPCLPTAAGEALAEVGVFSAPLPPDREEPELQGPAPRPPEESFTIKGLRPSEDEHAFLANIARIKEYIAAGDTYQVNYTLKLLFDFSGSPEALYQVLRRNQPVAYGAALKFGERHILSLSPELFFRVKARQCTVRPMKGTMARGRTLEEDARLAEFLRRDEKNRSENVMIVDLLRNDLGRLCEMGTVRAVSLFDIETYATLHQMTSTIEGRLRSGLGLADIFTALFPCGSVTGAPKIRTMEIIHELESAPRGVYTGAIGYIAPNGDMAFNVPIRTVALRGGKGEMGIGSGIVHDSDPAAEWRECLLKGRFLTHPRPPFRLIETLPWNVERRCFLFCDEHLSRLRASAAYFGFSVDTNAAKTALEAAAEQADDEGTGWLRVRLLCGPDGFMEATAVSCACPGPFAPPRKIPLADNPPTIILGDTVTDSSSPMLYHKTTDRGEYDKERQWAIERGHYEVIFRNERGEITEGAISNIMILSHGRWLTPPVACGLLAGVCRERLLKTGEVREQIFGVDDLRAAEAVCVMNSVRGVVPVRLAENR